MSGFRFFLGPQLPAPGPNGHSFSRITRSQMKEVLVAMRELMTPPDPPKRPIGFVEPKEKKPRE